MRITRTHLATIAGLIALAVLVAVLGWNRLRPPAGAGSRRLVRIAAASDLRYVLEEVTARLHDVQPALDVQVAYGSSGNFFAQLTNGAPFDLFMSADIEYPRQLQARGLTVRDSEFVYAMGRLAVWVQASSPLDVENAGMEALVDSRVAHVAIANPQHAPYGRAAEAAMRRSNLYDRVKPRIVLGENVSQALQFVQSGAAQAGIVALSLAVAPSVKAAGRFWVVPAGLHPRLEQGGIIMRTAADPDAAQIVRAFLLGDDGRTILNTYGFSLPDD